MSFNSKRSSNVNKNIKTLSNFAKEKITNNLNDSRVSSSRAKQNTLMSKGKDDQLSERSLRGRFSFHNRQTERKFTGKSSVISQVIANESFDDISEKGSLKDIIDNANAEQKMITLINETIEVFNQKSYNDKSDEKERYELVDKVQLEKMKKDNEVFKEKKKKFIEENKDIQKNFAKINNELISLTNNYNSVEKQKSEYLSNVYALEYELKHLAVDNNRLYDLLEKANVERDNIFRALLEFNRKYEKKIPQYMKEIYKKFNEDQFKKPYRIDNTEKISTLKAKLKEYEAELENKTNLLTNIKKKISLERSGSIRK